MKFGTPLVRATLQRRYKRFLADCILMDGTAVIAHCANPGSMMGLAEPGTAVWLEPNDDPKKKLKYGWRLVETVNGDFVGVDTSLPNRAVRDALLAQELPGFAEYGQVRPEVRYGEKSRIDFLLRQPGLPDLYLEVKSVTLSREAGLAEFPDSVTARGARHMEELAKMVREGHRAVVLFLVQRTDCSLFRVASDIDPTYADALNRARAGGVEIHAIGTHITPDGIDIAGRLDLSLE